MTPRSEVNGLVGRDWGEGEGKREGGWRTYNYPSQHKFSSNPSVPFLGCQRVFFALLGTTKFSGKAAKGRLAIQHLAL